MSTFTEKDAIEFIKWLRSLKLPRTPDFSSDDEKRIYLGEWLAVLSKYDIDHLPALKSAITRQMRFYPTISQVVELLDGKLSTPILRYDKKTRWKDIKSWNDRIVYPGVTIISRTDAKKLLPTEEIPEVNMKSGEITYKGEKSGNISKMEK